MQKNVTFLLSRFVIYIHIYIICLFVRNPIDPIQYLTAMIAAPRRRCSEKNQPSCRSATARGSRDSRLYEHVLHFRSCEASSHLCERCMLFLLWGYRVMSREEGYWWFCTFLFCRFSRADVVPCHIDGDCSHRQGVFFRKLKPVFRPVYVLYCPLVDQHNQSRLCIRT